MRISDWSSDVCSSDLLFHLGDDCRAIIADSAVDAIGAARSDAVLAIIGELGTAQPKTPEQRDVRDRIEMFGILDAHDDRAFAVGFRAIEIGCSRSEEHTSELQSLMRISYAVFCLKNTNMPKPANTPTTDIHTYD